MDSKLLIQSLHNKKRSNLNSGERKMIFNQRSYIQLEKLHNDFFTMDRILDAIMYKDMNSRNLLFFDKDQVDAYIDKYTYINDSWLSANFKGHDKLISLRVYKKFFQDIPATTRTTESILDRRETVTKRVLVSEPYYHKRNETAQEDHHWDLIVGILCCNEIRTYIPNFIYTYGGFVEGNFVKDQNSNSIVYLNQTDDNHMTYIVTENYEAYEPLKDIINRCSANELNQYLLQIMLAYIFANNHYGFVHGKAICENILISKDIFEKDIVYGNYFLDKVHRIAKISDFSRSSMKAGKKHQVNVYSDILTLLMSCMKNIVDIRSDIYSLCMYYWKALSGQTTILDTFDDRDERSYPIYQPVDNNSILKFLVDKKFIGFIKGNVSMRKIEDRSLEILKVLGLKESDIINETTNIDDFSFVMGDNLPVFAEEELEIMMDKLNALSYEIPDIQPLIIIQEKELYRMNTFNEIKKSYYMYASSLMKFTYIKKYFNNRFIHVISKYSPSSELSDKITECEEVINKINDEFTEAVRKIERNSDTIEQLVTKMIPDTYIWYIGERRNIKTGSKGRIYKEGFTLEKRVNERVKTPIVEDDIPLGYEDRTPVRSQTVQTPVTPVRSQTVQTPVTPVSPVRSQTVQTPVTPVRSQTVQTPVTPVTPVRSQTVQTPVRPVSPVRSQTVQTPVSPVRSQTVQTPVTPVSPVSNARSSQTTATPVSPAKSSQTPTRSQTVQTPVSNARSSQTTATPVSPVSNARSSQTVQTPASNARSSQTVRSQTVGRTLPIGTRATSLFN